MSGSEKRNRVLFAGATAFLIVALRLVFVKDEDLGIGIIYVAVIGFFAYIWTFFDRTPARRSHGAYSDFTGPNQGWDPRTIEAMRRRADGIE